MRNFIEPVVLSYDRDDLIDNAVFTGTPNS